MPRPKPQATYVNFRGEPWRPKAAPAAADPAPAPPAPPAPPGPPPPEADLQAVFDALCLAGSRRGKTFVFHLLRALGWPRAAGPGFSPADVGDALHALRDQGRVEIDEGRGYQVPAGALQARLPLLLARADAPRFWPAWVWAANSGYGPPDAPARPPPLRSDDERLALARLVLAAGLDAPAYNEVARRVLGSAATASILLRALDEPAGATLLARLDPSLRWGLLVSLDALGDQVLGAHPALLAWVDQALRERPAEVPAPLRLRVAERRLHAGEPAAVLAALEGSAPCADFVPLFDAALQAWHGRWEAAATAFGAALKALAKALGRRRDLAPDSLLQWHALALLAQPDPAAWTAARKFCVAQSGSRTPSPHHGWGLWAHAAAVRLGDEPVQPEVFEPSVSAWGPFDADANADRFVLAAWLGQRPARWTPALLAQTAQGLVAAGRPWKADLLRQACERLGVAPPPADAAPAPGWPARFFGAPQEAWRDALAAIAALDEHRAAGVAGPVPTLRWQLQLDAAGRVADLQALERPMGVRGPGKPRPLTLAKLKKSARLDAADAAVARCIRAPAWAPRDLHFDLPAAAAALVGHPDLVLADAPEQPVELRESLPTLEVRRETRADGGACYRFMLEEPLIAPDPPRLAPHWAGGNPEAEIERRNSLRIVRETPQRARLIRITPAQRRVAELVAKEWAVPVDAQAELEAALRALAGHFVLHSDAAAGQPVPAEPRLRAQLLPRGEGLELRLVVRPFGDFGPTLAPASGRARLLTLHQGLSLSTERDLAAEAAHLQAVLDALPSLGEAGADASWWLEDPAQCLDAVERLGRLPAVAALEWPRGRALRVTPVQAGALRLNVKTGHDWFALDGELQLDEQRVLGLQQLMSLLQGARQGRFVALGEGEYLALTEQLRRQLDELQALAGGDTQGLRLPTAAASWLAGLGGDTRLTGDRAWAQRAARLEQAAALQPALPPTLRAELRPYQAEGFAWMARLAHAGFGACLADDMGLGKTVQTLALLLARAGSGPALVVAPTSVCANWADEAARFAPTLQVLGYAGGARDGLIVQAGPGDMVIVSYALLLRDAEAFAARPWGTLVLDEAQALKNAATKRTQAVATLAADFRLALSGTPVENRLADLWSIMSLLNPGLLGSAARFGERFVAPIERQHDDATRHRLRRLVGPFLLRRTKAQVLTDLPPRTEILYRIEPEADERSFLEAARRNAVERVAALAGDPGQAAFHVLAELTRLRRAACDPRLVAPALGRPGAKTQAFEALAAELVAGGHQALVFSQFTDFLKLLAERLAAAGIGYQYLDGSTPAATRADRVAAFQRGEGELFLISLKAGGFGLNLTAADYVIIADPWWNPAAEDQAMGRAHRIGQLRPVTVYRLVTAGSIEERIVELHRDKRALADGLLADQDSAAPLRAADLMALLAD